MDVCAFNISVGVLVLIVQCILNSLPGYESDDHTFIDLQMQKSVAHRTIQLVVSTAALFDYHLRSSFMHLIDKLQCWVKPRSMTWFSDFLVRQYDRERWIHHF
jgi:hypothetical protein